MGAIDTAGNLVAALQWLTEQSGGKTFSPGKHPLDLVPYLDEFRALLDRQYLVEIAPPPGKDGRPAVGKLRISTEPERRLRYPSR